MNTKIIAEVSGNHAGKLEHAHALVNAAKDAGATHVKFQAFTVDEMCPLVLLDAYTLAEGPWAGRTLRGLYTKTRTPLEWLPVLFDHARELGLEPFASVFGEESLAWVSTLRPNLYKIASAEALDLRLVKAVQAQGVPVLASMGCRDTAIPGTLPMWCVAEYPAGSAHLGSCPSHLPWGLSDHTRGVVAGQLAVALGAKYLEKHLMLDDVSCEDEAFSLTVPEFRRYVQAIEEAESHLTLRPQPELGFARRWVAATDLKPGPLKPWDLRTARANRGILANVPLQRLRVAKRYGEPIEPGEAE